jgi:hypothetical protein
MITAALFLFGLTAFCQQEENGTIYMKHPYIDVVNNATKAYEAQDWAAIKNFTQIPQNGGHQEWKNLFR